MLNRSRYRKLTNVVWILILTLLTSLYATEMNQDPEDWADLALGAVVVEADNAHNGDVWGLLGKDGGYRLIGNFPYRFTIDFGQMREIQSLYMAGPQWGLWSPDVFAIDYMDESGHWHNLVEEDGWAEDASPAYMQTFATPVQARQLYMEVKSGGWHEGTSSANKERIRKAYGDRLLLSRFSVYSTTRVPELMGPMITVSGFAGKRLEFIEQYVKFLPEETETYQKLRDEYEHYQRLIVTGADIQLEEQDQMVALNEQLKLLERKVAQTRNVVITQKDHSGYLVGTLSPYERSQIDLYSGPVEPGVSLYSAGHEYEDFQIALVAVRENLNEVQVEVSDLVSEDGQHTLSNQHVTLYRGVFINTEEPHYTVDYSGKWLDGLVPLKQGDRLAVKQGQVQPVWGTLYTPAGQAPGKYLGKITIRPDNGPVKELAIEHHVWNFSLPKEVSLKNVFSLGAPQWRQYYGKGWFDESMKYGFKEFGDFWLKRRLNPTSLYINHSDYLKEPMPEYRLMDHFVEAGMNAFNLGRANDGPGRASHEWFDRFLERIKKHDQEIQARGLEDKAFIYLADEPFARSFDEIIRRGREIKKVTNIPTYIAIHQSVQMYPEEFKEVVDIWGPVFSTYERNREWFQERRREGDQVWWYFVGWGINMDQSPLKARVFPWLTWNEGLEGVMQWCGNRYWHPGQTIDDWNGRSYQTHNGVGNYVYPGPNGEMYPSIRLEHIRDGMEDYEYLRLLETIIDKVAEQEEPDESFLSEARAALDMQGLITGVTRFTDDYRLFEQRRQWIGKLIESKADLIR